MKKSVIVEDRNIAVLFQEALLVECNSRLYLKMKTRALTEGSHHEKGLNFCKNGEIDRRFTESCSDGLSSMI